MAGSLFSPEGILRTMGLGASGWSMTLRAKGKPMEGTAAWEPSGLRAMAKGNGASAIQLPAGRIWRPLGRIAWTPGWLMAGMVAERRMAQARARRVAGERK